MVSSRTRPHFTPGKDPVPILQMAGWAPGPVWTGGKSRPNRDSIPDRPARSQSLYQPSYPAHTSSPLPFLILQIPHNIGFSKYTELKIHVLFLWIRKNFSQLKREVFDSWRVGKYLDVGTINCTLEKVDNEKRHDLYSSSRIVSKEADRDMEAFSTPNI